MQWVQLTESSSSTSWSELSSDELDDESEGPRLFSGNITSSLKLQQNRNVLNNEKV